MTSCPRPGHGRDFQPKPKPERQYQNRAACLMSCTSSLDPPALFACAGAMTWQAHPSGGWVMPWRGVPTSLNEGRGEVVVPALVVVLACLVDGWARNGGRVSGSPKCGNVPNTEGRNGAILGRAKNGISRGVQQCRKPVVLVLPRASRAEGGMGDRYLM